MKGRGTKSKSAKHGRERSPYYIFIFSVLDFWTRNTNLTSATRTTKCEPTLGSGTQPECLRPRSREQSSVTQRWEHQVGTLRASLQPPQPPLLQIRPFQNTPKVTHSRTNTDKKMLETFITTSLLLHTDPFLFLLQNFILSFTTSFVDLG